MQYQLREHAFSLSGAFDILDQDGLTAYMVQGRLLSLGNSLDMRDALGQPVAHIQQRLLAFTPTYDISRDGQIALTVHQQAFSWVPRFDIEGPAGFYTMVGDWADWNFQIESGGQTHAWISRQFSLFNECYGVNIAEGADVPTILCLAIVMDEVVQSHRNSMF